MAQDRDREIHGGREGENASGREKQGEIETGPERDREPGQEGQDRKDTKRQEQPTVGCGVKIKKLPRERRLGTERGEGASNGQRNKVEAEVVKKGERSGGRGLQRRGWRGDSGWEAQGPPRPLCVCSWQVHSTHPPQAAPCSLRPATCVPAGTPKDAASHCGPCLPE